MACEKREQRLFLIKLTTTWSVFACNKICSRGASGLGVK